MRVYAVDLSEAVEPNPGAYPTFNAFFTRALRPGTRPQPTDDSAVASPADGVVSEFGQLLGDRILQAKGQYYSVDTLLANDLYASQQYHRGRFATIYLAPGNYHRVHAPLAGQIHEAVYVPGTLFSVNARTARVVPNLFTRNERVILHCSGAGGPFVVVLIGAMLVGNMELVCCKLRTLIRQRQIARQGFDRPIPFARGAELGRFNMGSTVIVLFPRDTLVWSEALIPGHVIQMGQVLGRLIRR
ncbi:MAG: phosphatidylserine decarboxylase [Gammaproteobacteria bacterium]|nr:phosphatidylserine decarboxylase [Gammaproteobacteria bacterium]